MHLPSQCENRTMCARAWPSTYSLSVCQVEQPVNGSIDRTTTTTKIFRHRPRDTKCHTNIVGSLVGSDDELLVL
jgi:hypothetical protein